MPVTNVRVEREDRHGRIDTHNIEIGDTTENETSAPQVPPPILPTQAPPPIPPRVPRNLVSEGVGNDLEPVQLVDVDQVIIFEVDANFIYHGRFHARNLTHQNIMFKIKTTSPRRFTVRPTIGVLPPEESATLKVDLAHEEDRLDGIGSERFQFEALILTNDNFATSDSDSGVDFQQRSSNFEKLNNFWKSKDIPGIYKESYRLKCMIRGEHPPVIHFPNIFQEQVIEPEQEPNLEPPTIFVNDLININPEVTQVLHSSTPPIINENEIRRRLISIHDSIDDSSSTLEQKSDWNTMILYAILLLMLVSTFLLYNNNNACIYANTTGKVSWPGPIFQTGQGELPSSKITTPPDAGSCWKPLRVGN